MNNGASKNPACKILRWLFVVSGAVAMFVTGDLLVVKFVFPGKFLVHASAFELFLAVSVFLYAFAFLTLLIISLLRRIGWIRRLLDWRPSWRTARQALVGLAVLVTLYAVFVTEENWRGRRAWENCKRELEAQGVAMDWNAYIPPPVPDDQNVFKAPIMQRWFVKTPQTSAQKDSTGLSGLSTNYAATAAIITNEPAAADYLKWSDQFQPSFDLIREALKRPYARMDGDYSRPFEMPIPNFVRARNLAQVFSQRVKCNLFLGRPEKALADLTLLNDSRRLLEGAPAGKPMSLVAAMINVAITGLYVETIAYGLQSHGWRGPQLAALQEQLQEINLPPIVAESLREEPVSLSRTMETVGLPKLGYSVYGLTPASLWQQLKDPRFLLLRLVPRGWYYQNMAVAATLEHESLDGFDLANNLILPEKTDNYTREFETATGHWSPWNLLARIAAPNFRKAVMAMARNQTWVDEGLIACALERYRLAHGEYPGTLDALVPQFIEKLPHDIIGGQPLKYRRMDDGKFLLYSVGWDGKDDGGDAQKDWVWGDNR
jgi:hypothetical protein